MISSRTAITASMILGLVAVFAIAAAAAEIPTEITSLTPVQNGNFGNAVAGAGDVNDDGDQVGFRWAADRHP